MTFDPTWPPFIPLVERKVCSNTLRPAQPQQSYRRGPLTPMPKHPKAKARRRQQQRSRRANPAS